MIHSHLFKHAQVMGHAVNPPGKTVNLHHIPAINWISPQLPGFAKVIQRHPGNGQRFFVYAEHEQMRMRPHVCAVQRYVDKHIADPESVRQ